MKSNKCSMYSYFSQLAREYGFRKAVKTAKAMGFCGVEILDTAMSAERALFSSLKDVREARAILEEEHMIVVCYSVATTLYRSNEAVEALKMHAEYASVLGSPFLHHTLYLDLNADVDELPYEKVCKDVLPRAIEVAEYCKKLNLTCLYEDQGMYFNGIENFGKFYRSIKKNCDNVGVCGDFGNSLFVDCAPSEFLMAFASEIRHVHIKDYFRQSTVPDNVEQWHRTKGGNYLIGTATGHGVVDIPACMRVLVNCGYGGYYSLEQELQYPEPFCSDVQETKNKLYNLTIRKENGG